MLVNIKSLTWTVWNNYRGSSSDDDDEPLRSMAETTNGKSKQVRFDEEILK